MHVIISDQRMPIMTGVELLRRSREISPHSVRILLTGYSDLAAIVGSINDGEVYRFISKPWDDQALQTIVAEAATIALELADTKTVPVTLAGKNEGRRAGRRPGRGSLPHHAGIDRRAMPGALCKRYRCGLDMLKKHEIAVVVADVESSQEQLTDMLKLLKQEYPQILSIVTTKAKDAEMVIDLINQAQVFRILHKPINVGTLKAHVHAALQRYLTYEQTPQLVQAHKVEAPEKVRTSSFAMNILKSLQFCADSPEQAHSGQPVI